MRATRSRIARTARPAADGCTIVVSIASCADADTWGRVGLAGNREGLVISVRLRGRGAGAVARAVGAIPAELALCAPLDPPPVFVHQLVVPRAQCREVVEVGRAALPPEHDVMRLRERIGSAAREAASAVAVADLAQEPRRRDAGDAADAHDTPGLILVHGLDARRTQQALQRRGVRDAAALDLGSGARIAARAAC